jgi:hypothetical protein
MKPVCHEGARARGAILVEAVIVIAAFTLFFVAFVFFRQLYVAHIVAARLARGSAIAFAMGGCENNEPQPWLGQDGNKYDVRPPAKPGETIPPREGESVSATGSDEATGIVGNIPGLSGGAGVLNPIATTAVAKEVGTGTRSSRLSTRRALLSKRFEPHSYVTCGDVVRNGQYDEVLDYAKDSFGGFIK